MFGISVRAQGEGLCRPPRGPAERRWVGWVAPAELCPHRNLWPAPDPAPRPSPQHGVRVAPKGEPGRCPPHQRAARSHFLRRVPILQASLASDDAELRPKHPGWVVRAQSLPGSAGNFLAICRGCEGYFGSASYVVVVGDCWEERKALDRSIMNSADAWKRHARCFCSGATLL